jgi:hypothetical protein
MTNITLYITDKHATAGYRQATLDEIMTGARQALAARVRKGTVFTSPKVTADYLIARLGNLPYEVFTLIYLDTRHRFIACRSPNESRPRWSSWTFECWITSSSPAATPSALRREGSSKGARVAMNGRFENSYHGCLALIRTGHS